MIYLIVDDSPIDRLIARRMLMKRYGDVAIHESENVPLAINWLKERDVDDHVTVLLDIKMPVYDGFDFLQKFENLDAQYKENVSIIMISSTLDSRDLKKAREHHLVKSFIEKPLTSTAQLDI